MDVRSLAAIAAASAGAASLVVTAVMRLGSSGADLRNAQTWLLAEPLGLTVLVFVVVRWAPPRAAALSGSLAALGSSLWVQRFLPDQPALVALSASAGWLIPSLAAGTVAWYLRWAAVERARTIAAVRAEQRLRLAVDLHDFVAHDISEIVARAQAGTAVLSPQDPRVAELLRQIEAAGLRALESMDRTVRALGDDHDPAPLTRGGLDDIDELVRRFASVGRIEAVVDRQLTRAVAAPIETEAHRTVVEALTNVRRHADGARRVTVTLTDQDDELVVTITDDGQRPAALVPRSAGGLGLVAMTERAEQLGGRVTAGPRDPHGWQVRLTLPLAHPDAGGTEAPRPNATRAVATEQDQTDEGAPA